MTRCTRTGVAVLVALSCLAASQLAAQVTPDRSGTVGVKEFRHPDLDITAGFETVDRLPSVAGDRAQRDLDRLAAPAANARVDVRSNRFAALTPSHPLIPGKGNALGWGRLGMTAPRDRGDLERAARQAFASYLRDRARELRIDVGEVPWQLATAPRDSLVQIYAPRVVDGIPVRDNYLSAVVSHGNVVLLGTTHWGDVDVRTEPSLSLDDAMAAVGRFAAPYTVNGFWGKGELNLVPLAAGGPDAARVPLGRGLTYRLAWVVRPAFPGEHGRWEALVDAHSGEVFSFADTNQYAEVKGGVLPVTNDGIVPDGVEQPGWPMPYADVGAETTDTGGNFTNTGTVTTDFFGPFVNINDNCGTSSLTGSGVLDWGTSLGTDCTTPGFGGAGNTHASRTGFYELNKVIEMARGQLPGNSWLQSQLISNMNINNTCNAFWNGTVNFYRSGGGCFNTGEIAGVFDHEWGHGMDANDATPGIASPSGEGIADVYTALRLNTSCIGRNFRSTVCSGNGDPCLTCTGVRDIDYLKRASGQPHDYSWSNANCGGSVHCVGGVYSEAVWSLWKRKLQSAPYSYDNNTAHEIVTRMTFLGAGATGTWFSGGPPNGGCAASSGYMNYLAADDDNGNLNDGTPHMTAIFAAFDDQEIACATPAVVDSGCSGTPTAAPSVSGTAADKSASLSWTTVAGTTEYEVFRTEGVFACDFGKVRLGATTGTVWNDTGLQNGRDYSYVVIPKGPADSCFGNASSCTTVTPASGPNLAIDTGSAALSIAGGDADPYLDNCEDGTMTFDVDNTGLGALTNVRVVGVVPSNGGVTVSTGFPSPTSPSTLAEGATGSGSFSFTAGGLAPGETLTFQVEVTADELAASRFADLVVLSTETDLTFTASQTYSFESGTEGWTTAQGTFNRSSAGGGASGTTWYEQSSANLDNQCDQIQSPVMVLSATSTLALWNNHDIEPFYIPGGVWYDRANVGVQEVATGTRTAVSPDGGRLYNASGANGNCGTTGQGGWADAATSWASSSWSAGALGSAGFAGQAVQLDIRYGTDASLNGFGFRFDEVTVTNVSFQGADGQSDTCGGGCTGNPECDDGLFCNGAETCNAGTCQAGTPVDCDDLVDCTDDACNEAADACDNIANDANCDDGFFCTGVETCDVNLDCQSGTAPDCDDGVGCTVDSCNGVTDACDNVPDDGACPDDGLFCNGTEFCDPSQDCQSTGDPCSGAACDEVIDVCVGCDNDDVCESGEDCVSCPNDCISGTSLGAVCGNGLCETADGEDCVTCAADCNGQQGGKPSNRFCCGNGGTGPVGCADPRCFDGGLSCTTDPAPSGSYCCGDAICEDVEDNFNCEIDCGPPPCGDGFCDPATEDQCSCALDCGTPPLNEVPNSTCDDGIDNDCDIAVDCADLDCAGIDPACICGGRGDACSSGADCCSGQCKNNGTCR